jgi:hypothetical protein
MVNCRSILIRKYIEFGLNLNMGILKSVGSDERSKVLKSIRFNEVKHVVNGRGSSDVFLFSLSLPRLILLLLSSTEFSVSCAAFQSCLPIESSLCCIICLVSAVLARYAYSDSAAAGVHVA